MAENGLPKGQTNRHLEKAPVVIRTAQAGAAAGAAAGADAEDGASTFRFPKSFSGKVIQPFGLESRFSGTRGLESRLPVFEAAARTGVDSCAAFLFAAPSLVIARTRPSFLRRIERPRVFRFLKHIVVNIKNLTNV